MSEQEEPKIVAISTDEFLAATAPVAAAAAELEKLQAPAVHTRDVPLALGFDWETTGLPLHMSAPIEKQPRGIEWGGALISLETGEIVEELNVLINPGIPLEPIITKITGLTDADLADQPFFADVVERILPMYRRARTMFAHNLPFDRTIAQIEAARLGIEWPFCPKGVCTAAAYSKRWGKRPKLLELYEWSIGKPLAQTHRAIEDVRAMVEVVQKEELWRTM